MWLHKKNDGFKPAFMKYRNIHIGKLIKQKFDESKLSISAFAKAIQSSRTNVYNIFNSKSIDIDKLILISKVLNYNFLDAYLIKDSSHSHIVLDIDLNNGEYSVKKIKDFV